MLYLLKEIDDKYVRKDHAPIEDLIKRLEDQYSNIIDKKTKEFEGKIAHIIQSINSKAEESENNSIRIKSKLEEIENNARLSISNIWNIEREAKNAVAKTTISTGLSDIDDTDIGILKGKSLKFLKESDSTALRIVYTDNFRVAGIDKSCRWEIMIDGNPCPSGALIFDRHDGNSSNNHDSTSLVSYCEGIPKGTSKNRT